MPRIEPRSPRKFSPPWLRSGLGWIVAAIVMGVWLASPTTLPTSNAPELEKLLDEYFQSWSRRDLRAYEQCFHAQATIHHVDHAGFVSDWNLAAFVRSQTDWLAKAAPNVREIPLTKQIHLSGDLAQAQVRWQLINGSQTVEGYDDFTLVRSPQGWKILSLVYQEDRQP